MKWKEFKKLYGVEIWNSLPFLHKQEVNMNYQKLFKLEEALQQTEEKIMKKSDYVLALAENERLRTDLKACTQVCLEMRENNMKKLKKCPFCGSKAETYLLDYWVTECKGCFASIDNSDTKEEAMAKWNRRNYQPGVHDVEEFYKEEE